MVDTPIHVNLRNLIVKRRNKVVLGPVDLDLKLSDVTIVLGPNGAGKTTLLKSLHGVERLSGGTVQWSIPDTQVRQSQAYVFQSPIMLRRSVRQNLAYPLDLLGLPKAEIADRVNDAAISIGLLNVIDSPAPRLSGGERQKLALARALIRKPRVLFLDEPCANLDGRSTREIESLLRIATGAGTKIIMATHDLGQARRLANNVIFLLNGSIHEQGYAQDFFEAPQSFEAKSFLRGDIVE